MYMYDDDEDDDDTADSWGMYVNYLWLQLVGYLRVVKFWLNFIKTFQNIAV